MKIRRNRTHAERSIIFSGALGGSTLDDINARLASVGARPLPQTSYDELRRIYVPFFEADLRRLDEAIKRPPTRVEVRAALTQQAG